MISPFSFIKSGAAATHDPATDNLSLWLRSDSVTGTTSTLSWASKASAGSSGSAAPMDHSPGYDDLVAQPSTALDGYDSVLWSGLYPLLLSTDPMRAMLGAGDSTPASYTVAYVVQPLASNSYALDGGGKTDWGNPGFLAAADAAPSHAIMSDGGTAKFGVHHYNADTVTSDGTTPVTWPGGFGAWGLLWVSYTSGGNIRIRINGSDLLDAAIATSQGPSAGDYPAYMGSLGGGAYVAEFRLVEVQVFPGQALTGAALTTREAGYFATRYPSLGL